MRRTAGLVLVAAALAVLTACGGGAGGKPAASSSSNANALEAYTTCLSQNGIKLPSFARLSGRPSARPSGEPRSSRSPGSGFGAGGFGTGGILGDENNPPQGVDAATWKAALTACASKRPTFSGGNQNNSAFAAYRNCLQDHGVTLNPGSALRTADPKAAAALKTCAPLRPTPNGSSSASPTN